MQEHSCVQIELELKRKYHVSAEKSVFSNA